jgi:hypothetical protein
MAADGRKLSQLEEDNVQSDNHRFVYYDPDEALAADQNKTGSLSEYFNPLLSIEGERSAATSGTISKRKTVFDGTSAASWTLPAGSASIQWREYFFDSVGTANWTINRAGSNTINDSDTSFIIYPAQRGVSAYWDGETWIFRG